jgi:predicted PurR-regulated permease PerM
MTSPETDPEVEASLRRVRRGCVFIALIVAALGVMFTAASGNLFYLTLIVLALFLAIVPRLTR